MAYKVQRKRKEMEVGLSKILILASSNGLIKRGGMNW